MDWANDFYLQGVASAILDGAMRNPDPRDLRATVAVLQDRGMDRETLELVYEIAHKRHRKEAPSLQEVLEASPS